MTRAALAGLCLLLLGAAPPPEPPTYRLQHYEAPTPLTLSGADVLSTSQARALWQKRQAVFVDVLPRPPRPAGLPAGTIWRDKPRADIPRSIWLPDTGYGALAAAMQDYLERGLQVATGGDHARRLVFYCKPDCWMSWNAAKRAVSLGYTNVGWYPDGDAGWIAAGLPVESREPVPGRPGAMPPDATAGRNSPSAR